jgi:hypothetical protein
MKAIILITLSILSFNIFAQDFEPAPHVQDNTRVNVPPYVEDMMQVPETISENVRKMALSLYITGPESRQNLIETATRELNELTVGMIAMDADKAIKKAILEKRAENEKTAKQAKINYERYVTCSQIMGDKVEDISIYVQDTFEEEIQVQPTLEGKIKQYTVEEFKRGSLIVALTEVPPIRSGAPPSAAFLIVLIVLLIVPDTSQ